MTITMNAALVEQTKLVVGCAPALLATTAGDGDYVSMKNYHRLTVVLLTLNGSTVTASDVTALQATAVAGTNAKALAIAKHWKNEDAAAADTLTAVSTVSDTFATSSTNAKQQLHVFEIRGSDLDVVNGFDCVRVDVANSVNSVGAVLYILWGNRYAGATNPAAITD